MYASEQFYSTLEETFNGASKRLDVKVIENEKNSGVQRRVPGPGHPAGGGIRKVTEFLCVNE